jgi:rhodanese-related sulfurtransferase
MKTLSMTELHEAIKGISKNDLILDVRTPQEFAGGHVPTAANIPVDQVMMHAEELKKFGAIYIYCKAGVRAETASEILESMGVANIYCVNYGGFPTWEASGFLTEK